MIPRPRINLLIYHGAFAPRGRCHNGPVVAEDAPHRVTPSTHGSAPEVGATSAAYVRPSYFPWADLLRRVFAIDILACPDCGGRLRLLATIEDRAVVEKILTHLGLPVDPPCPSPARTPVALRTLVAFDAVRASVSQVPQPATYVPTWRPDVPIARSYGNLSRQRLAASPAWSRSPV